MPSGNAPVPMPISIEGGGWWQAMAVVRGEQGGGAWPTVGLRVGDANDPQTAGIAAIGEGWGRVTVGRPIWLEAGETMLLLTFENDFAARGVDQQRTDRNLDVDRIELLRVERAWPAADDEPGEAMAAATPDLRVSTTRVWHGRRVTGPWTIEAKARAIAADGLGAPWVHLELDGRRLASQRAWAPRFELPPSVLRDGPMRLVLRAELADGRSSTSPPQTIVAAAPMDGQSGEPFVPAYHRFAIDDEMAWDELGDATIDTDRRWGRVARLYSNGTIGVRLPEGLTGRYVVSIRAQGERYDGLPEARVRVRDGRDGVLHAFEPVGVDRGWRETQVGEVELDGRAERVTLDFINDKYGEAKHRDRNLHVAALMLRRVTPTPPQPPRVVVRYPLADAEQHTADALVADLAAASRVAWVELLIDGHPTGIRTPPRPGGGRAVLPVVWTGFPPGGHELSLRVRDIHGRTTDSPTVRVRLLDTAAPRPLPYERAVRLLDRFAFGVEPRALADVLLLGPEAYLRQSLTVGFDDDPGVAAAWQLARTNHTIGQAPMAAVGHLLHTPNPVRARLTLFLDNHFNTWLRKARPERKLPEHERFVELGAAPFLPLLEASATSPAMLQYLDQLRSFAGRINENYAREIMELHTLGVDSTYRQQDVTELSHLLAGWLATDETDPARLAPRQAHRFHFAPELNDAQPHAVFGLNLPAVPPAQRYDRARRVIEMLAAHPDTARHLARKLVEHYLVSPAPDDLVDHTASAYLVSGGDLAQTLLALATHPDATGDAVPPRLKRPLEFAVGLQRRVGDTSSWRTVSFLNRTGTGMFDRETPDGYDAEPQSYANSNAMLQRWRLAKELEWPLYRLLPDPLRSPDQVTFPHATPGTLPDGTTVDRHQQFWLVRVIDTLAVRLTGTPLGDRSRQAAYNALGTAVDNESHRARMIAVLTAQLPESQQQR
jgi:hypothetical protein